MNAIRKQIGRNMEIKSRCQQDATIMVLPRYNTIVIGRIDCCKSMNPQQPVHVRLSAYHQNTVDVLGSSPVVDGLLLGCEIIGGRI